MNSDNFFPKLQASPEILAALASKKVFLFDFDGVLVDSISDISASVNATLSYSGFRELPEETLRTFVGDGARNLIMRAFNASAGEGQKEHLSDDYIDSRLVWYKDYYNNHAVIRTTLFPGVMELLRKLKEEGAYSAIVSNKPLATSLIITERLGISPYLSSIIGPENTGRIKPAPDGLKAALEEVNKVSGSGGYGPEDVLMTGDSPQDIMAGKNFGCMTCAVLRGYSPEEKLRNAEPDLSVGFAGDLLELFTCGHNL